MPSSGPSYITEKQEEEESGSEEEIVPKAEGRSKEQAQVFQDPNGYPIWFHLHESLNYTPSLIEHLTTQIKMHGGVVRRKLRDVDTVLIDEKYVKKHILQLSYDLKPQKEKVFVEPYTFIKRCIQQGYVIHCELQKKGMGGGQGRGHNRFTKEEDEKLAWYLSRRIPEAAAGARRGEGVYLELEDLGATKPEYTWVRRHTAQSWRNRYNKNVERFNLMIDKYVRDDPPSEKGLYRLDRRLNGRRRRQIEVDDASEGEDYDHYSPEPVKRRRTSESPQPGPRRSRKGKERANNTRKGSDEEMPKHSPLFTESESEKIVEKREASTPRSAPRITYASRKRPLSRSSPPPYRTQPQTSQVTRVVATPLSSHRGSTTQNIMPDQGEQRTPDFDPDPHADAENEAYHHHIPSSPVHASDPPEEGSPAPVVPSDNTEGHPESQATGSQQRRPVAIKKARRPRVQPPVTDTTSFEAPYRNTRARSRSVEPPSQAPPPHPKPRRKKDAVVEESPVLAPVEELSDEEQVQLEHIAGSPEAVSSAATVGDTVEEEMDVQMLLVDNISGHSHTTTQSAQDSQEESPEREQESSRAENDDVSMESDDIQTDHALRHPPTGSPAQRPTSKFNIDPDEMLRQFEEEQPGPSTQRTSKRLRTVVLLPQKKAQRPKPRVQDAFEAAPSLTPSSQPTTPKTQARAHRGSSAVVSSEESFPVQGTKASAVKKRIQAEEKQTPYRAPQGTRAAAAAVRFK